MIGCWSAYPGRVGIIQPAGEKAPGRTYGSLSVLRGPTEKVERDFLQDHVVIGKEVTVLN